MCDVIWQIDIVFSLGKKGKFRWNFRKIMARKSLFILVSDPNGSERSSALCLPERFYLIPGHMDVAQIRKERRKARQSSGDNAIAGKTSTERSQKVWKFMVWSFRMFGWLAFWSKVIRHVKHLCFISCFLFFNIFLGSTFEQINSWENVLKELSFIELWKFHNGRNNCCVNTYSTLYLKKGTFHIFG